MIFSIVIITDHFHGYDFIDYLHIGSIVWYDYIVTLYMDACAICNLYLIICILWYIHESCAWTSKSGRWSFRLGRPFRICSAQTAAGRFAGHITPGSVSSYGPWDNAQWLADTWQGFSWGTSYVQSTVLVTAKAMARLDSAFKIFIGWYRIMLTT